MIQIEMMKVHQYMMTDEDLVLSNLYRSHQQHTVFPSLSKQTELETEMDFYKQKLDFVHVVSHEVRNPLTVIQAYAQIVKGHVTDAGDREKLEAICDYVKLIDNEITHIINTEHMLSTDLLWRKKLVLPKVLLAEVIEFMKVKARTQNIELQYELSLSGKEVLLSNTVGFKLIVSNLLSNAIKYSEEGMRVRLHAEHCGEELWITVADQGIGMSEEQQKKLFQKYEKLNEEKGGQGIGLFMVKKLIDHFDGTIEVKSEMEQGTCVVVKLPLYLDVKPTELQAVHSS
jgi:signal transduction histidine kinase